MSDKKADHTYTYPNPENDPDRRDVLRNRFGFQTQAELNRAEYRITNKRMADIEQGLGPAGKFDTAHLKSIHKYLFEPVYEWAGHMRNERPVLDGKPVEPVEFMSKNETTFLPASRLNMGLNEAFRPIKNPDVLKGSTAEQFSAVAGQVMSELNFVHPFREGNGRAQEAFVVTLGRAYGHDVDFSVISKPRLIAASIASTNDPASPAMRHLIADATDPGRTAAIKTAFTHLRQQGEEPLEHDVRTARPGEQVTGSIIGLAKSNASLVTDAGIVVVPKQDLPRQNAVVGDDVTLKVTSAFVATPEKRSLPDARPDASQRASNYWSGQAQKSQGAQTSSAPTERVVPTAKPQGPKLR